MNIVAIVQARMGSTRLPGKVFLPLAGKTVLSHVTTRLSACKNLNSVVVATSVESEDDAICEWCVSEGIHCFRGSLTDVLDRYYRAAQAFCADAVVRITADCPALDPEIVDEVIEGFLEEDYDAYHLSGEFPDGLDCQVFAFRAIERAWQDAELPSEREHVGPYIEKNLEGTFKVGEFIKFLGLGHHRWTLDDDKDLLFLTAVFDELYHKNALFKTLDILDLIERKPYLKEINSGTLRNEGYLTSLQAERQ